MKITLPDNTVIEGTEEEIQRVLARLPIPRTEVIGHPLPATITINPLPSVHPPEMTPFFYPVDPDEQWHAPYREGGQ
jgi:hypothetical protein